MSQASAQPQSAQTRKQSHQSETVSVSVRLKSRVRLKPNQLTTRQRSTH